MGPSLPAGTAPVNARRFLHLRQVFVLRPRLLLYSFLLGLNWLSGLRGNDRHRLLSISCGNIGNRECANPFHKALQPLSLKELIEDPAATIDSIVGSSPTSSTTQSPATGEFVAALSMLRALAVLSMFFVCHVQTDEAPAPGGKRGVGKSPAPVGWGWGGVRVLAPPEPPQSAADGDVPTVGNQPVGQALSIPKISF